jgi:hypothetical protein
MVVAALGASARLAAANDADVTSNEAVPLVTTFWPYRDAFEGTLYAGADSGTRTGVGVIAGGGLRTGAALGCGVVETGGQLSARVGPAPLGATHWLRACLPTWRLYDPEQQMQLTFMPILVDHVLELSALPRLSMKRIVLAEPYTSEQLDLTFSMASVSSTELEDMLGYSIEAMPGRVHLDWLHQSLDDGTRLYESRHWFSMALIGGRQTNGGDLTIFRGRFERDLWRIDLVDFDDFRIGETPFTLDLAFGSGDTTRYVNGAFVTKGGFTGRFGAGLVLGDYLRASVHMEREYYETIDDAIIGDSRAEAKVRYTRERWQAIATAFRSHATLMWTDGSGEIDYRPTHGAQLELDVPLAKRVDGKLSAAWARSFYARMGSRQPTPEPGFELQAQIVARLGRYRGPR